jgi:hypothetical protein
MLADLLSGLANGFGFMFGALLMYTIYDYVFTVLTHRHEKAMAAKRKKRRR